MPVNQTKLEAPVKGFTKKDFEEGKCTKEGFALDKEAVPNISDPTPTPETSSESPDITTAAPDSTSTENPSGDNPDSEKSPDNSD